MPKSTVKQCEWNTNETGRLEGSPNNRCREAGYVFYRAASGWGHWLCAKHRDAWKESDRLRTATPEQRWENTYRKMGGDQ